MKYLTSMGMTKYFMLFLVLLLSCKGANDKKVDNKSVVTTNSNLDYDLLKSKIKESISNFNPKASDFKTINKLIRGYIQTGIVAIPVTENIIKNCIGSLPEPEKDSLYFLFIKVFYTTANKLTDSLETKYAPIIKKLRNNLNDSEVKEFKSCLDLCGIGLFQSEGDYYLDVKYDYFYNVFKGKVSPALDDFLEIRSGELKQGFSEDAGMLISFEDLYERVVKWEDFKAKYPNSFMSNDAEYYYNVYLSTFLSGMDNSRTFDLEEDQLSPNIKKLYEKIIARNDSRRSSKIIKEFYNLLKTTHFKKPENLDQFLKDRGFYSMLGVQPDLR